MKYILVFSLSFFVTTVFAIMPVIDAGAIAQLGNQLVVLRDQLNSLKNQALFLQLELKQLQSGQYQWSNVQNEIIQLGNIVQQTNGIAYNAQDVDVKFKNHFPGYKAPSDYQQQYQQITNSTQNTLNGVLRSLGSNAQDFQNENMRLAFLQRQAQSAQGQTQAIQAASQIASEQVSQIQLLRQTVIAQTNAQTVYYAAEIQKEASAKAELGKTIQSGSTDIPAYGTVNPINIPKF